MTNTSATSMMGMLARGMTHSGPRHLCRRKFKVTWWQKDMWNHWTLVWRLTEQHGCGCWLLTFFGDKKQSLLLTRETWETVNEYWKQKRVFALVKWK